MLYKIPCPTSIGGWTGDCKEWIYNWEWETGLFWTTAVPSCMPAASCVVVQCIATWVELPGRCTCDSGFNECDFVRIESSDDAFLLLPTSLFFKTDNLASLAAIFAFIMSSSFCLLSLSLWMWSLSSFSSKLCLFSIVAAFGNNAALSAIAFIHAEEVELELEVIAEPFYTLLYWDCSIDTFWNTVIRSHFTAYCRWSITGFIHPQCFSSIRQPFCDFLFENTDFQPVKHRTFWFAYQTHPGVLAFPQSNYANLQLLHNIWQTSSFAFPHLVQFHLLF